MQIIIASFVVLVVLGGISWLVLGRKAAPGTISISPPVSQKTNSTTAQQSVDNPSQPATNQTSAAPANSAPKKSTTPTITPPASTGSTPPPQIASNKPAISVVAPVNGAVITGNTLEFDCSTSTPAGFKRIEFYTRNSMNQDVPPNGEVWTEGGCGTITDSTYMDDGQYTTTFTIIDLLDQTASASTTYTIQH